MSRPARAWDDWEDDDLLEEDAAESLKVAVGETAEVASPYTGARPSRRVEPTAEPKTAPRRRVRWGQLTAVSLVGYLAFMGISSQITYMRVSHQSADLARQAAALTAQNKGLTREIALLHQRRYVDELARTELGYTSPGEVELVPRTSR